MLPSLHRGSLSSDSNSRLVNKTESNIAGVTPLNNTSDPHFWIHRGRDLRASVGAREYWKGLFRLWFTWERER